MKHNEGFAFSYLVFALISGTLLAGGYLILITGSIFKSLIVFLIGGLVSAVVYLIGRSEVSPEWEMQKQEWTATESGVKVFEPETNVSTLVRVPQEWEASLIVGILTNHGIKAELTGTQTASFRAEAPVEVSVLVREDDLEEAKRILIQSERTEELSVDPQDEIDR